MTSTRRFAVLWILVTVPTLALLSPIHLMIGGHGIVNFVGCLPFVLFSNLAFSVGAASAAAFGQEWLLGWHRRPLRRWWAFMTAGAVLGWIAHHGLEEQILPWFMRAGSTENWKTAASRSLCNGIAFGVAAGFSLWGRRWPPIGRSWLAGVLGIYALQALLHGILIALLGSPRSSSSPLAWSIALKGFDATVAAAGTVLLLETLILRPPSAELTSG